MNSLSVLSGVSWGLEFLCLTFVSEDAALFGAAALVSIGALDAGLAFVSVFLGIWGGDLLIFGLARKFGVGPLHRIAGGKRLAEGQAWVARHGWWALWWSRFVPGLRLPALVGAGVLRGSLARVALITGLAGGLWVGGVISAASLLPGGFSSGAADWLHRAWWILPILVLASWLAGWFCNARGRIGEFEGASVPSVAQRIRRWEFWPGWIFYAPVGVYYLWLGLRYRGLSLPAIANPGLPSGGLVGESKFEILSLLQESSPESTASGVLIAPGTTEVRLRRVKEAVAENGWTLPVVLKPDVGQRGAGVRVIGDFDAVAGYLASVSDPVLLQEYAPGPCEAGVFYYRLPGQDRGSIFSITEKIFPVLIGDGVRSVAELIQSDGRARFMASVYLQRFASRMNQVLDAGEHLQLVQAGNHAQGCIFRDGMHLFSDSLHAAVDSISRKVPGFFIGRFDLRYSDDESLRAGRFTVVELNGSSAEATSIYDERNSLAGAYRKLFCQWRLVMQIGAANRDRGVSPPTLMSILRALAVNRRLMASYPVSD